MEKGKLKIFFGYSAGVGKTYSMLVQAREQIASGVDVVIGYVEPHARPETAKLTDGIETIKLKNINYKGIDLTEFDIDKAIERRPELILVDELAHTNAGNSKHKKRFQDVLELINNGINVYTTVNVQHLEGLNDIIDSATSVKVGETIPDDIFDHADEVELIDIEPKELANRLRSGKIYHGVRISTALENFFTEEHLNNLREVSMRRCADRIAKQQGLGAAIAPKVLALISPSPSSQKNIRIAAQMAGNYHCKFIAMYVERSGELDDESAKNFKSHVKLVNDLDGELVIKYGESVVETISTFVKLNGVTSIIIGKTWQSIGKKVGLEDQIIAELPEVEVLIVPDRQSATRVAKKKNPFNLIDKIYMLVASVLLLSVAGLYFVSQIAAFAVAIVSILTAFSLFFFERRKRTSLYTHFRQNNKTLDCINYLIEQSKPQTTQDKMESIAKILSVTFSRTSLIEMGENVTVNAIDGENGENFNLDQEVAIRKWCIANGKSAGKGTETLRHSKAIYFPIIIDEKTTACVAFSCENDKLTVTDRLFFAQLKNILKMLLSIQSETREWK